LIRGRSGKQAHSDFIKAAKSHQKACNILLIDSDGPNFDNRDDSVFWIVQMMEAWFYADKDKLEEFYGRDFRRDALKANPNVEEIAKADLISGLKAATGKHNYFDNKTSHGPALLALIRPEKVRKAAPNCDRLFTAVLAKLAEPD